MNNRISTLSRLLCLVGAVACALSIFLPTWRIELDAPQYPEGLVLYIGPDKVGGDIEVINGLNHYIGMKTIHSEDFVEFSLLPYVLGCLAALTLANTLLGRKKLLFATLLVFVLFGIFAMVDFWRWNYNYGHDLDPNAAIKVPGMAYQPPLIGYKQLLNFGAFSVPDKGGILLIICGGVLLISTLLEAGVLNRLRGKRPSAVMGMALFAGVVFACEGVTPVPIKLNQDSCEFCKMTISDSRFATECITEKGRIYKFDDLTCMHRYVKGQSTVKFQSLWICDFNAPQNFVKAEAAHYVVSQELRSPMAGNMAGFLSSEEAKKMAEKYQTNVVTWDQLPSR